MAYGFKDSMERTQQCIYDFQLQHPTSSVCGYYVNQCNKLQGFSLSEFIEIFFSDTQ